MKLTRFNAQQRSRLTEECGLLPAQIEELEKTLALSKSELTKPATLTEVRSELRATVRTLTKTADVLQRVIDASSKATNEARIRIIEADFETDDDGDDSLQLAKDAVQTALASAQSALDRLPKSQRRGGNANPNPIGRIERALRQGFVRSHEQPFPPYILKTSRTKAPFPQIVAICYEAIGLADTSEGDRPDRAIRAYIEIKNSRRTTRKKS